MDEPLSNLDAKLRGLMRVEILKLHQKLQTTFVYVTHDQVEAMTMGSKIVVMKDGIIHQIDAPQTLYERPNNVFVAEFIGNPKINVIDVVPEKVGDNIYVTLNNDKVLIPSGKGKKLEDAGDYIGNTLIFGVRAEDIHDEEDDCNSKESSIKVTVDVVENLGSETIVHFDVGGVDFTGKLNPTTKIRPGDTVTLYLDTNRIHLFDKETESAIIH
jgi:multiple sugar transport system ATP-binding protein